MNVIKDVIPLEYPQRYLGGNFVLVEFPNEDDAANWVFKHQNDSNFTSLSQDRLLQHSQLDISFNDPNYEGQWYLEYLEAQNLFSKTLGKSDVIVAVIDSGIDISHPDLSEKVVSPKDIYDDDDDPSPNEGEFCYGTIVGTCDEHGTAVAGIAVAKSNNEEGIVGLCSECSLLPIKMLGEQTRLSADISAFNHAIDNGAWVINNSWGYTEAIEAPASLVSVITRATTEGRNGLGAVVVFAAGNDNREIISGEMCDLPNVICASAINTYGQPTNYTNYGSAVDIAAPSATVSIAPNNELTIYFGGTSAAAPVISGIVAWILSIKPDITEEECRSILINSAEPSPLVQADENGHHPKYGYGVINTARMIKHLFPKDSTNKDNKSSGCSKISNSSNWILLFISFLIFTRRK